MLNHLIILPTDGKHFISLNLLKQLQDELKTSVIYDKNFIFHPVSLISEFGKETGAEISLFSLASVDLTQINSVHLLGSFKQLEFLQKFFKQINLNPTIFFTCTSDELIEQKNAAKIILLEDIFFNDFAENQNALEYLKLIKTQSKNLTPNTSKIAHFSFKGDHRLELCLESKLEFILDDKEKSSSKVSFPQSKKPRSSFSRKLHKLKNNPYLFFKDMIKKRKKNA